MPSLVEIGPVVLEKKILKLRQYVFTLLLLRRRKCEKFPTTSTARTAMSTENGKIVITKAVEPSAQVS